MGSTMEPNAQAMARYLEKRGIAPAFCLDRFPYDATTNIYISSVAGDGIGAVREPPLQPDLPSFV
jgi:hypothetical protein